MRQLATFFLNNFLVDEPEQILTWKVHIAELAGINFGVGAALPSSRLQNSLPLRAAGVHYHTVDIQTLVTTLMRHGNFDSIPLDEVCPLTNRPAQAGGGGNMRAILRAYG